MQFEDMVRAAIQDAGLNLDDFNDFENFDTNNTNVNNEEVIAINNDDPFSMALKELEIQNKKADEINGNVNNNNINEQKSPIRFVTLSKSANSNLNDLINYRNNSQTSTQITPTKTIQVFNLNTKSLTPLSTNQIFISSLKSPIQQGTKNLIANNRGVFNGNNVATITQIVKKQDFNNDTKPSNIQITKVVPSNNKQSILVAPTKSPIIRQNFVPFNNGHQYLNQTTNVNNNKTQLLRMSSMNGTSQQRNRSLNEYLSRNIDLNQICNNVPALVSHQQPIQQQDEEIVVDEEEELGYAETYADYMPSKLQIGIRHPDPVVETSSLASVEPPEVWYNLKLPESSYINGALSALQLEAIVYACQKHETFLPNMHRSGFLVGDGAGVGKGRTIAGIIYENYLLGRKKALWLSVSNDLKYDAERDFHDIGATRMKVHSLNKLKYTKISSKQNSKIKKGVVFATYSSLIGESQQSNTKKKYNTRIKQLLQWLGKDFDGIIVFDECHKAKNLVPVGSAKPTKTGLAVLELQEKLPNARIVYASATGASEPKNMAYMVRLGLWGPGTPFNDFNEFIQCIEKRGVGAMEIVAMDMKLRGMYMARQLSFSGVTFKIEEIKLTDEYVKMYDDSVQLWVFIKEKFQEALDLIDNDGRLRKIVWGQFWSAHQRFFKYLCMASKVTHVVDLTRNALHSSKCVVIGLQSTGEARTLEQLDEYGEINEFISTTRGVLQNLVDKHFPVLENTTQNTTKASFLDILGIGDHIREQLNGNNNRKPNENKNSKKVNEILKRLTSYTNQKPDSPTNQNSKPLKSTNSSTDSSVDSNSTSSENEESDNDVEDEKADFVEQKQQPLQRQYTINCIKSLDSETECDSDDSDALFSIIRYNNPKPVQQQQQSQPILNNSNAINKKKKKKKIKKNLGFENENDYSNGGFDDESSTSNHSSDEELKLPAKRIKLEQPLDENNNNTTHVIIKKQPVELTYEDVKNSKNIQQITKYLSDLKTDIMQRINDLGKRLPANTLDELIDSLDGPQYVAEMTGRKGRIVATHDEGVYAYETRSEQDVPLELLNIVQKERFMNGEKLIAIISEAASSGISLQANRRNANQRRRVHITIELPWSADRAIQQFGRTHRSNQVSAPEYIFLISELAGEKRFASTVAKRLESLGALTHGDRRATETRDLSQFNIDNKYGRVALENVIKSICGLEKPLCKIPPSTYIGNNFLLDSRNALIGVGLININKKTNQIFPDKDYTNINKFLNRLLGCPVNLQNSIFNYFSNVLAEVILDAKRTGKWDMGILDLGTNNESVCKKEVKYYILNNNFSTNPNEKAAPVANQITRRVELNTVIVERGLCWDKAMELYSSSISDTQGFYISNQIKNNHRIPILALFNKKSKNDIISANVTSTSLCIYRPNTGLQVRQETYETLKKKYKKVTPLEAKQHWEEQYYKSVIECTHVYRQGSCSNIRSCEIGLRNRKFHILAGSVLTVWTKIENILCTITGSNQTRLQIIRIRTQDNEKIVGCVIPQICLQQVETLLNSMSVKTYKNTYDINRSNDTTNNHVDINLTTNLIFNSKTNFVFK